MKRVISVAKDLKKACLYLRFSDDKQKGGTSIDVQEQTCKSYCANMGFQVVDMAKNEAISAKATNERRVADLLAYCKERAGKFDVLVVYKLDRFARDQFQHHYIKKELLKMGVYLRSATERIDDTPSGHMIEGVLAAMNQYDNELKSERVKLAMWHRVEEGLWPWQPPIGYMSIRAKDQKVLPHVPDPALKQTVIDIFTQFSTGTISQFDLSNKYKPKHLRDYKGRLIAFSPQTMSNLLNNVYYAGKVVHEDGRLLEGKHEKLISYELFLRCQMVIQEKSNNRSGPRSRNNPEFPLMTFIRCAACGTSLTAQNSNSEHSGTYRHYFCHNKQCPQHGKTYRGGDLETGFSNFLSHIKPTDELTERFKERFVARYKARQMDLRGEYMRLHDEVGRLAKELDWVIGQGKKQILTGEYFEDEYRKAQFALDQAKMALRDTHGEEIDIDLLLAYADSFIQTVEKVWFDANFEYKKKLQNFILPGAVSVANTGKEYSFSNPGISRLFKLIQEFGAVDSNVVTPRGNLSNSLHCLLGINRILGQLSQT